VILQTLFDPQTIAVVGASDKDGKMGNLFVRHLLDGYSGQIFPVHPETKNICGLKAYQSITDIPGQIDLLIPLIPSGQVPALVKQCKTGKVKFLLAIPSGFGEVPDGGKYLEAELLVLAREKHIRIVGPNSLGILNCGNRLNASMVPRLPPGGSGFSCITQSGGFGMAINMYMLDHQLEMAKFCDLGNSVDITPCDLLEYFRHDADTCIVGAYLESFLAPEKFFDSARSMAAEKPLILTRLGRTAAGSRASYAHLGISPGDVDFKLWIQCSRIIPAHTGLEMIDIAKGLSWQPLPEGRRVGIITGAGGIGVELTDLCLEHGLEVPEFSPQLQAALQPFLPNYTSVKNPVDLTPLWQDFPKMYPPLMRALFDSAEVDILIIAILDVAATVKPLMYAVSEAMAQARMDGCSSKPLYIYWAAPHGLRNHRQILQKAHIPCYQSTLSTVSTTAAICRYAMWKI
jgi:acetyltransferase